MYKSDEFIYGKIENKEIYQETVEGVTTIFQGLVKSEIKVRENKAITDTKYFIASGQTRVSFENGHSIVLRKGAYFQSSKGFVLNGSGVIITRTNQSVPTKIGLQIEDEGRLKYIDGCKDSLLLSPEKKGYSCLNALYFPKDIDQTNHTHPSIRCGLVYKGQGTCITPSGEVELEEGNLWIIRTDQVHKFRTNKDQELIVIAYHPDSDFGPEDEFHPMLNRTIVNGISANKLKDIQTK
jgi:quercetin dioxygenase-like cupin family protein